MIKRKSLFAVVAGAGIAVSTGVAYAAVSMTSNTAAAGAPEAAVDLANVQSNASAAVFLEADLNSHGEWQKYGRAAGDPNGKAVVILRITRNQIMYEVSWQGMTSATGVRLEQGNSNMMNFMAAAMPSSINAVVGVVNLRDTNLVARLLTSPGGFSANLLTPNHSGGAVRGAFRRINPVDFNQILHVGPWSSVDSGDQEIGTVGDMDGHATVFIGAAKTTVTFAALWNGVTSPTALDVNKGAVGAVGTLVTTLFKAPRGLDPTIIGVAGTVPGVPAATVAAMAANPAAFHTNLLSGKFPNGAVRGQLFSTVPMTMAPPTTTTTTKPTTTMPTTTKPVFTAPPTQTMTNPPVNPSNPAGAPTTGGVPTHW